MKPPPSKAATPSPAEPAGQDRPAGASLWGTDDAEGWYRRGFEHGAYLTFESANHMFKTEEGRERLRQWVEVELRQWRMAAQDDATPDADER